MRVLVVHNRYRSSAPSGEGRVADLEIAALRERGVEVVGHFRRSDELLSSRRARVEAVVAQVRPAFTLRSLRSLIRSARPDVIHLHNPFPLVPPSIVTAAHDMGVPVVQSLHNLRHSRGRSLRSYGQSLPHALLSAGSLALNRRVYGEVDRFVVPSEWLRSALRDSQLPRERIVVIPNGIPDPGEPRVPGEDLLFVGRLEVEKGIDSLLTAWREIGPRSGRTLVVAGSGPLESTVAAASRELPNLRFVGRLSSEEVEIEMAKALAIVVPSVEPESFGLAAVEAFAAGRPVICSSAGALGEIVDDAVGWNVTSDAVLAQTLADLDSADARSRGVAARQRYLERFTIDRATDNLIALFQAVVAERRWN